MVVAMLGGRQEGRRAPGWLTCARPAGLEARLWPPCRANEAERLASSTRRASCRVARSSRAAGPSESFSLGRPEQTPYRFARSAAPAGLLRG